jgi:ParB family chromosome partitioning protein
MAEKRGLGRGLSALLGDSEEAQAQGGLAPSGLRDIPIDLIHRKEDQPRFRFDEAELEEEADEDAEKLQTVGDVIKYIEEKAAK